MVSIMEIDSTKKSVSNLRRAYCFAAGQFPFVLMAIALTALFFWQWRDVLPSGGDGHAHFAATVAVTQAWMQDTETLLDTLHRQGANHMPLLYLSTAVLLRVTGGLPLSLDLVNVGFWAIACLALIAIGFHLGGNRFRAVLPLAAMLAVPAFWDLGCTYSLEVVQMAGVSLTLALFFAAERLRSPSHMLASVLAAAVFSLSRATALVFVVPVGLVLCLEVDWPLRFRRGLLLTAIVLTAGIWIGWHFDRVFSEFPTIPQSMPSGGFSFLYYLRTFLIDFRGLPLAISLMILLFARFRRRDWCWRDAAFFILLVAPLLFYQLVAMLRPWYIRSWYVLPSYFAFSGWMLFSAQRLENVLAWVRTFTTAIAGLYGLLAVMTVGTVFFAAANPGPVNLNGIRRAAPLPEGLTLAEARDRFGDGLAALLRGEDSAELSSWLLAANPQDLAARLQLAAVLARQGKSGPAQSELNWLFAPAADFGMKVEALAVLAELEAEGLLPNGEFDRRLAPLLTENAGRPDLLYTLLSAKVRAAQLAGDWPAAIEAIGRLRTVLRDDQTPGVDLSEALAWEALGEQEKMRRLLDRILIRTASGHPVRGEALLAYARCEASNGNWIEAGKRLELGVERSSDKVAVNAILPIARLMASAGRKQEREQLLLRYAERFSGQPAALLWIELANTALAENHPAAARSFLLRARDNAEDPATVDWIEDSLQQAESEMNASGNSD